jgi:transcriptional regulator with XRE-family HTH domain
METIMDKISSPQELEMTLGRNIKILRLQKNIDRKSLSLQAGISETALRNLEGGKGATLKTLTRVVKALNKESWLNSLAPQANINPLHIVKNKPQRQRASRKPYGKKEKI